MYTRYDKKWADYCKLLGLNPYDKKLKGNDYLMKGFKEWARLNKEYSYYRYQSFAISYPKW